MRLKHLFPELEKSKGWLVASFGSARLMKSSRGKYRLIGGSREDQSQALEWISLFGHEIVPLVATVERNEDFPTGKLPPIFAS